MVEPTLSTLSVLFVRTGPVFNQLITPLASYMVSVNGKAELINLPFDEMSLQRGLAALFSGEGAAAEALSLRDLTQGASEVLAALPRLSVDLYDSSRPDRLVQVDIASAYQELSLVPFELWAHCADAAEPNWVTLKELPRVIITRSLGTRSNRSRRGAWPARARVLLLAGPVPQQTLDEHVRAMLEAMAIDTMATPGVPSADSPDVLRYGDWLTVARQASLQTLVRLHQQEIFTHVHLVAESTDAGYGVTGMVLRGQAGAEPDVVSAERMAQALTCVEDGRLYQPLVLSVVSVCASGGRAIANGARSCHALCAAGIPLVLGSHAPLRPEGASLLTRLLYKGLLFGSEPLSVLHGIRQALHALGGADWANLIVYENLPNATLPTLMNRPMRAFLCHASEDKPAVRRIYRRFVEAGIDAWLDVEKLRPGQDWALEIRKAVRHSDAVVVCLSQASTRKVGYVQKEIRQALDVAEEHPDGDIFIVPIRLDDCEVPERLAKYHCVSVDSSDGLDRLIEALQLQGARG